MVGRTGERALLRALAERAADGTRSAVLVRGEAGVGKSRLVATLAATADDELGMTVVTCACDPYHRGSALYPVLAGLREHGIALPDGGAALARMSPSAAAAKRSSPSPARCASRPTRRRCSSSSRTCTGPTRRRSSCSPRCSTGPATWRSCSP